MHDRPEMKLLKHFITEYKIRAWQNFTKSIENNINISSLKIFLSMPEQVPQQHGDAVRVACPQALLTKSFVI